ncbi:MAG: hypothetical protein IH989_04295 [Planctomycetes bacterium]|nr:hypothetical protein [Planctomycetota bacterium]
MLSFAGLRTSIGFVVGLAAVSSVSSEARAGHYRGSCRGAYATTYYQPRYYSPSVVYVAEPAVYVERVRPRVYVRYRSYSRPYRHYRHGTTLGHAIRHLFHDGHRYRHSRRGHGHHDGHRRRHRW